MSNKVAISFVLPVYNVSCYLCECVDSIISTEGDYEVLLVDDGSTDDSGYICDKYAEKHEKIFVYHKKNGGLSDARNYGLHRANGDYVAFIDSDDYLCSNAVKYMLEAIEKSKADVLIWDSVTINENKQAINTYRNKYKHPGLRAEVNYLPQDFLMSQLNEIDDFARTVWLGMYRRDFLLLNNFWFEKGLLHEDELWTPKVYLAAANIYYVGKELYFYRIRQNSIMNRADKDYSRNLESSIFVYNQLPIYYDYIVKDGVLKRKLKADVSKHFLSAIAKYNTYSYPCLQKEIRRWEILKNATGVKNCVRSLVLLCSIKLYCLLDTYFKN